MLALWTKVQSWMQEDKGASMVEYALLVVLIAIIALIAVRFAGQEVSRTFSEIGSGLASGSRRHCQLAERPAPSGVGLSHGHRD
jgi:Flp pilus assembly pilin Flp